MPCIADMNAYRKRKAKARVFLALEHLYMEVLSRLEDEQEQIDPNEFEEFMAQVLGDHLVGDLENASDMQRLDQNYRRFDARLRQCLQTKLKTLQQFERVQKR